MSYVRGRESIDSVLTCRFKWPLSMELIPKVTRDAFHVVKKYINVCSEVNKIHLFSSLLWDLWRKGTSYKVELVSRLEHSE